LYISVATTESPLARTPPFESLTPPAALAGAVVGLHGHRGRRAGLYRRLPMPWCALVLSHGEPGLVRQAGGEWTPFPRLALQGLSDRWTDCVDAPGGEGFSLALIEPWAVEGLFGIAPEALNGRVVALDAQVDDLCELADWLAEKSGGDGDSEAVAAGRAVFASAGVGLVSDFARNKRGRQAFRRAWGVGPKTWARLSRFSANLRRLHGADWVAAPQDEPDYFDQSHEIRDFRRLAGVTPAQYRRAKASGEASVYSLG
jgi:hypothetical protein